MPEARTRYVVREIRDVTAALRESFHLSPRPKPSFPNTYIDAITTLPNPERKNRESCKQGSIHPHPPVDKLTTLLSSFADRGRGAKCARHVKYPHVLSPGLSFLTIPLVYTLYVSSSSLTWASQIPLCIFAFVLWPRSYIQTA